MADIQQSDAQLNGVVQPTVPVVSSEAVGSKRQRRPSVQLGDIGGDQTYDSHLRRPSSSSAASKQWKHQPHLSSVSCVGSKSSKTCAVTNPNETFDDKREANKDNHNNNLYGIAIGSWRVKDFKKRPPSTKRIRSNWVPIFDDSGGGGGNNVNINGNNNETDEKYSGGKDNDDFDMENSESPIKEQSPIHCLDNLGIHGNEREVDYNGNNQRRPMSGPLDDGVTIWLNGLGLGRYARLFEIHEVDDEVLPLLTLEDLKDMGINAVGSRRKLFCAIQKLSKGFL
ncbi:hypothetical protein F3Y22_tig00111000pilonHSYRG00026 [Hibiscus syriacus]|uniref:SAM domain-containing protein n=1 Tax=Hibiscus syriacus TaxID=106335 RepID=A0A6A2Z8Z8_HIBSY|nr:putative mediator of RNA polymerase II transcription subunit 24 [Hibiscus syriacus]KAE8688093.1 hypothetical protein F3Y22_tig00111000pilonHSYRG00026 [Hibiscus syriacus]